MNRALTTLIIALLLISTGCQSSGNDSEKEDASGIGVVDDAAIDRIDSTLRSFVDLGEIAGVSALIYEKDKEVYFNAFGFADIENQVPMDRNTIVKIYSMTKPITGVA